MDFKVRMADLNISITSQYAYLKEFCRNYLIDHEEEVQFHIESSMEEIQAEDDHLEEYEFSMEYLETLATQRKIADCIHNYDCFLMHGACISFQDKGYLFTAPSGTGKSTHIRLWKQYLKEYVDVVNGDKPFLSVKENEVMIYGSPWAGKEGWHRNCKVPLDGICIVARGKENKIHKVNVNDYLQYLLKQVYRPKDPMAYIKILELFNVVLKNVPVYYLECEISEEAVQTSFEAMTNLKYEDYKGGVRNED